MTFIVVFPDSWWLRAYAKSGGRFGYVATGDRTRATRYATRDEGLAALAAAKPYFKAAAHRAAAVVQELPVRDGNPGEQVDS